MMAEKARLRLFRDNRTLEIILSTSELQSHKRTGRSVPGFDNAIWDGNAKTPLSPELLPFFR